MPARSSPGPHRIEGRGEGRAAALFQLNLLTWFDSNARDLPWRRSRDPYHIWISEVMLQQTTVAAVIPYFHRFLERFPTIRSLADADQHDVLRIWEGLGYYRRARDLHGSARIIAAQHNGALPETSETIRELPGFGRYTTNAVLSQAFGLKLPILEANSVRLLCRLFAIADDPRSPAVQKRLWQIAEDFLPDQRVGDFNQALMELGALVCVPNQPRCGECPLAATCAARAQDCVDEIPKKIARPKPEEVREVAVVLRRKEQVFLVQRPAEGRWASMWEFPRAVVGADQDHTTVANTLLTEIGFVGAAATEITTIRHGVTRFRITLVCLEAKFQKGRFREGTYPRGEWVEISRLTEFPVSTPQRRLATLVARRSEP